MPANTAPTPTELRAEDIMPLDEYAQLRAAKRREMIDVKRRRRMDVGPHATFYFESFATMWYQVHEMLFVEKGGDAQLADELTAYNPLIPNGKELVATLMLEIEEPGRRARVLGQLGGVENTIRMKVGSSEIAAVPEGDVERTNESGKASSVHFLHFPFEDEQIAAFRDAANDVVLMVTHPAYQHMAVIPADVRAALAEDFSA